MKFGVQLSIMKQEVQREGRTVLCHAILCQNHDVVAVLLDAGADVEFPMRTKKGDASHPLHMAARLGRVAILK